jgi:broad specificity phosphatase PhoE
MIALALLRHGATAWNEERRIQGTTDLALSAAGRAAVARWRLPAEWPGRRWVTSPLARARETVAILAERHGVMRAVAIEPRLAEMSHGAWEGRRLAELRAELGAAMAANEARGLDYRAPGGESPRELQRRLRPWLLEVAAGGEPVLAITHKGVVRALYAAATGWDMTAKPRDRLADAALHCFRLARDGALAVDRLNLPLRGEAPVA